ncbi:MAG TPA: hypothetical protein VF868_12045 [Bacteroidia bacterium]|jgi:uncharacterized membrane protein
MRTLPSLTLLLLLLFSCNQPGNPLQDKQAGSEVTTDTLSLIREFTGIYADKVFFDCSNPGLTYTVTDKGSLLESVLKKEQAAAFRETGISVRVRAVLTGSARKGSAGVLEIKELVSANQENDGCRPYDYICKGNEPFWQVQVSKAKNTIIHYDPMNQKTIAFRYVEPEEKEGALIYNTESFDDPKSKILISISKEKCSDGMSDIEYSYSSKIIFNNENFKGCAIKFGNNQN